MEKRVLREWPPSTFCVGLRVVLVVPIFFCNLEEKKNGES